MNCCFTVKAQNRDCNKYLIKSDSVLSKSWEKISEAQKYIKAYTICLNDDNSELARQKLENIQNYDAISMSSNGKAGWARSKNEGIIYLVKENFAKTKELDYEGGVWPFFNKTEFRVKNSNLKYGFVDYNGNEIVQCLYDEVDESFDMLFPNLCKVKQGGKYGFIDRAGKVAIPLKYDEISWYFSENLLMVKANGKSGYLNSYGQEVIPLKFDFASRDFSEGLAAVMINSKYGFINTQGEIVIEPKYGNVSEFSEGLALVETEDRSKTGFIDKSGKIAIPIIYQTARNFKNGLAAAVINNKGGYINKQGKTIIPFIYESCANYFTEGLAWVQQNNKFGYIDMSGKQIIDYIYEEALEFYNGLAVVKKNGKYGYIDTKGRTFIDFKFDYAKTFYYPYETAYVEVNKRWFCINKKGEEVECPKF